MQLKEVTDRRTEKDWMDLPWSIYANDKNWIPHLRQDIAKVFDPEKNKLLRPHPETGKKGEAARWVLYDHQGKAVGRVAAFINPETAHQEDQPTGGMGFFECIDDQNAANMLFDTCREWLKARGMEAMDGPINLGDKNLFWGLLIENFHDMPVYGNNYNPEYYVKLFSTYGFQLYFKQLFYKRSVRVRAQPIFHRKYQQLMRDPDFKVRNAVGCSIEKIAEDFRTVYNAAWVDHENFKPMKPEAALKIMKAMKPAMDKRIMLFIDYKGKAVGFYLSLPELNEIFRYVNGNMNLIGKLKFLYHKWKGTVRNMTGIVFGVAKEWQGKGMEGALIVYAESQVTDKGIYDDTIMTWIGDFNPRMIKMCETLGAENYRNLATYRYLFDRTKPFERKPIMERKD
ncbi:MAG: hypothetical protein IPJ76_01170 [Flavobacteriales bacterium]|nr:MAG: hypothetical protein IPJ76_01170 [Flavobacteriales bacterium]